MITHDHEYLTVREAAELLRVSVPTVRRWIASGSLPATRRGPHSLRIKRADLYLATDEADRRGSLTRDASKPGAARGANAALPWKAALQRIRQRNERILARRGGEPLGSSLPLIHETRSERDERP